MTVLHLFLDEKNLNMQRIISAYTNITRDFASTLCVLDSSADISDLNTKMNINVRFIKRRKYLKCFDIPFMNSLKRIIREHNVTVVMTYGDAPLFLIKKALPYNVILISCICRKKINLFKRWALNIFSDIILSMNNILNHKLHKTNNNIVSIDDIAIPRDHMLLKSWSFMKTKNDAEVDGENIPINCSSNETQLNDIDETQLNDTNKTPYIIHSEILKYQSTPLKIGIIPSISPFSHINSVMRAISSFVYNKHINCVLSIYGNEQIFLRMHSIIDVYNLHNHVELYNEPDIDLFFKNTQILCVMPLNDRYEIAIIEAMAHKVLIIASENHTRYGLHHKKNAIIFKGETHHGIERAVEYAINHTNDIHAIINKAYTEYEKHFSYKHFTVVLRNIFKKKLTWRRSAEIGCDIP